MPSPLVSRRAALHQSLVLLGHAALGTSALLLAAPQLLAQTTGTKPVHPTPRAGITGEKVATAAMLTRVSQLVVLFDAVRLYPQIMDGIRCHCGCADVDGHYSLLSCYEGENAMAKICPICQGMGRVATRMAKAGRSLAEIREAVDAQYG